MPSFVTLNITFVNSSDLVLFHTTSTITYGEYISRPPSMIRPGEMVKWEIISRYFNETDGAANYQFIHNDKTYEINIYWNCSNKSLSKYGGTVSNSDYKILHMAKGSRYDYYVTFTFFKKNVIPLWYTETNDFWNNSYPTGFEDVSSPGHLVSSKNTLFYFYRSEVISAEYDVFYTTKNHGSDLWNKPTPLKTLGNGNSNLCVISYNNKIFIACRDHEGKIKLMRYESFFSEVVYYDLEIKSLDDLSLCIFDDKVHLFSKDVNEHFVWHFLLGEKNNSYKNFGVVVYWMHSASKRVIYTSVNPKTIVYKGLMYLIYATPYKYEWHHISFNGKNWSYPIRFIKKNYSYSPGLVVHRGLLKVAFVGATHFRHDRVSDRVVYEYSYDGNKWGSPMPSSFVLAGNGLSMTSYGNKLFAIYPRAKESEITNNNVYSHDEL